MRLFGLIGYPLGHSFSKRYFTQKFQEEGIRDCHYELFPLKRISEFPALIAANPDLVGLNVTIPYKEEVLPYLDEKGNILEIGACNCIHINEGKLRGYNTDTIGFQKSFSEGLSSGPHQALVLGSGGASKAVTYVLDQMHIPHRTVSRRGPLTYPDITPTVLSSFDVIINCTPLGTFPNVEEAPPIPYEALSEKHYLFDLVYNPEKTRFMQEGEKRGATIRNGYDMLRYQAEEAWTIWNAGS